MDSDHKTDSALPAIVRDLSLIVDESVRWEQIDSLIRQAAPAELKVSSLRGCTEESRYQTERKALPCPCFRDGKDAASQIVDGYQQAVVGTLADQLKVELRTA